ncbi:adenosylmethionine decarboxylase [Shewanella maritima]|uniref:Adenosylmethionine decarboxylase n=1 Tax=Shewanella maritima TaxID=2520507 RepID=A0A411PD31_9GAMM|nr:adenosylmethionine decarboxylase [Shewanella maritima]QBF81459.1 adenosylmethionine decarboxylase [Shewanella maritima]
MFEASEKKLEIVVANEFGSLRTLPDDFKAKLLTLAGAEILSHVHNDCIDAYVLSESSLFIWDNKLLLLTCGQSTLIESALYALGVISTDHIISFKYQRKSELFAALQTTTFAEDAKLLAQQLPGRSLTLGDKPEQQHFMFYYTHRDLDTTLVPLPELTPQEHLISELMLYQLDSDSAARFMALKGQGKTLTAAKQRRLLNIGELLVGFKFDDYAFSPCGYSLNAISGSYYLTLHLTPQSSGSYLSIETNLDNLTIVFGIFTRLHHQFSPARCDLVLSGHGAFTSDASQYLATTLNLCDSKHGSDVNIVDTSLNELDNHTESPEQRYTIHLRQFCRRQ